MLEYNGLVRGYHNAQFIQVLWQSIGCAVDGTNFDRYVVANEVIIVNIVKEGPNGFACQSICIATVNGVEIRDG